MMLKARHDVKKYVMTSKSMENVSCQKVRHDVKKYVMT